MSRKESWQRNSRDAALDRIFTLLQSGMSNAEVTARIDNDHRLRREAIQKGKDSEELTRERLKQCKYVKRVFMLSGNDKNDRRRKDLVVEFEPDQWGEKLQDVWVSEKPIVYVQVKSSPYGVAHFHDELQRRQRCNAEMAQFILHNQRLVVLDASLSDELFLQSFEQQMVKINNFWKTKNIPKAKI